MFVELGESLEDQIYAEYRAMQDYLWDETMTPRIKGHVTLAHIGCDAVISELMDDQDTACLQE